MVVETDYDSDDSYYHDEDEEETGEPTKPQFTHSQILFAVTGILHFFPAKRLFHRLPLHMQVVSLDLGMLTDFSAW